MSHGRADKMFRLLFTHPLDTFKVRMQLYVELEKNKLPNMNIVRKIYSIDGLTGFYNGLSASTNIFYGKIWC